MMTNINGKTIYGLDDSRAYGMYLYLQEKAREAKEARRKQVENAERWAKELAEINLSKRLDR